jgi:hypothetical protein
LEFVLNCALIEAYKFYYWLFAILTVLLKNTETCGVKIWIEGKVERSF